MIAPPLWMTLNSPDPTPADPNGMPLAWGHYDRSTSGAPSAVAVAGRAWPA